jgi:hypothetical protein
VRQVGWLALGALLSLVGPAPAIAQLEGTASFIVDKVLEGDALLRGEITIEVSCSNGRFETITYAVGVVPTPQVIGGLAAGTTCTVTEPVDGSNVDVGVTTTIDPPTIVADPAVTPTVRVVNVYLATPIVRAPPPGRITITKVLEGDSHLRGDIEIRVVCDQTPGFPGGDFVQTQTIPAGVDPVPPLVFGPIPAPADCTVTETVTGANGAVDVIVIGETTVKVNPNENLQLRLTNIYEARNGSLRVRKAVDGPGAALRGQVVLQVSCTDGTTDMLVLPPGQTAAEWTVTPIVATSQCTVTETITGAVPGVVNVVVTPPGPQTVPIADGVESLVEVRDTYTPVAATLQVTKVIAGAAAGSQGQVVLDVNCSDGTTASFVVPAGSAPGTTLFAPLTVPAGTDCALSETASGATATVDVTTTFSPGRVVTVTGATTTTVTNTYTFKPGGLVVTKTVAGDGATLRGPVTINVVCNGNPAGTVTYPPGAELSPLVVSPLPAGASCTVSETATGAIPGVVDVTTTISPGSTVVIPAGANAAVTVANTYTSVLGSLTVVKETAGQDELRGTITITAVCTPPTGPPVTASRSYPPRSPLEPLVVGGLPAGTTCEVTEPENGATPALTVTTTPTPPVLATIDAGERETVTITNTYTPAAGSLIVVKEITGTSAGQQGAIRIVATCGGVPSTLDIPAGATTAEPLTVTGLDAGTVCSITEPIDGSTPSVDVTITPALPITVTIPAGATGTATVTNQYEPAAASLTVSKTITGAAAAEHDAIVVLVNCGLERGGLIVVLPGGLAAAPVELTGLQAPITCIVTELLDGATDTVAVTTSGTGSYTLAPGEDLTVTVTNDFQPRPATLVLTKVITGDAAAQHGGIEITVDCGTTGATFLVPAGVTDPEPFELEGIAPGSTCTISEPVNGSGPSVAVSTSPDLPMTIGPASAGQTLLGSITNEYTLLTGTLVVRKEVSGPQADLRGLIRLEVSCTDGTIASIEFPPATPPTDLEVGPIPFGSTCTVTEPVTGAVDDVMVDGPVFTPGAVVVIDQPLMDVLVKNSYRFAPGTVQLVKAFEGPAAAERGTVRIRVVCGEGDRVELFVIPPGGPSPVTVTVPDVPSRTECRAEELNNGAVAGVLVTTTFEPPSQSVVAIGGQTVAITATNTYTPIATADLLVESILTGPAEPRRAAVELTVTCDSGRTITLTVLPGQAPDPALIGGLPAGTRCTVAQPLDGDTPEILTATTGVPVDPVEVVTDDLTTVQVTNVYTDPVTPAPSPSPSPTPSPVPRPSPSPGASGSGSGLAGTGLDADLLAVTAVVWLIAGAALTFCGRQPTRRRSDLTRGEGP